MAEKPNRKNFQVASKVNEMYSEYCAGNISREDVFSSPTYWDWNHLKETLEKQDLKDEDPLMELYVKLLIENLMILEDQIFPSNGKKKTK